MGERLMLLCIRMGTPKQREGADRRTAEPAQRRISGKQGRARSQSHRVYRLDDGLHPALSEWTNVDEMLRCGWSTHLWLQVGFARDR